MTSSAPWKAITVALSIVLVLWIALGAVPADADHTIDHCGDGRVCLFSGASFSNCKLVQWQGDSDLRNDSPCGFSFNDQTSSAKNRENFAVTLCKDIDFSGGRTDTIPANTNFSQVNNNDTASSLYYATTSC